MNLKTSQFLDSEEKSIGNQNGGDRSLSWTHVLKHLTPSKPRERIYHGSHSNSPWLQICSGV